jgi:hypothetical protein
MVCYFFTLNQQQKITKSKYVSNKGYAILDETDSDNIINAVAGEGIYDTLLGLPDKERRTATASKGYDASEIMFWEAKEGAVEAHNFSSSTSITTIYSKNMSNSRSVATEKMLAKSVFSIATSKVTSEGLEEEMDEDNDSDSDAGSATYPGVAIEGMQMLTRCRKKLSRDSMQEDEASGDSNEKNAQEHNHKEVVQLTKNMNAATAKLQLSSLDKDQDKDDNKEFVNAINRGTASIPIQRTREAKISSRKILATDKRILLLVKSLTPHRRYLQEFLMQLTPTSSKSPTTSSSFYGT